MRKFTPFFLLIGILSFCFQYASAQCGAGQTLNTYCYDNGEVDAVAFEFCPSASMAAQSDIVQGSFFMPLNDNLTIYSGASGSGTSGSIVFGPATGNLAGNNDITSLAADQCLIFVVNSNTFGLNLSCADFTELELQVCSESVAASGSVSFVASMDEVCITDGTQTISGGMPTGGSYSGTGVTDDGNGTSFTFNPATPGAGMTTVTYTNGGSASDDITVFASGIVSFTALGDLCIDAGVQTGLGGGTPTGGVYSGPGVTDDGNGMTYSFEPAIAGLGVHTISYMDASGCMETATDQVEVLAACGCPAGLTSHFYCPNNNETEVVAFEVCPSAGMAAQATITGGTFATSFGDGDVLNVYSGASGSGTGGTLLSGPLTGDVFGTVISGSIANECLIFVVSTGPLGSCQDGNETALSACGESIAPSVSFLDPGDFCESDAAQTLGGGLPAGGVYSGPGVTDDGNGMTFTFEPASAGVGMQTLIYTLGGGSDDVVVEVFPTGTVTFTALDDLCIDAGIQTNIVGGGMPLGGTYSGTGVTDNGNGTYNFNPAIAGLGSHLITYTDATGCMESAVDAVEVLAACGCPSGQQTFFHCQDNDENAIVLFEICPTTPGEAIQATIQSGTYGVIVMDDNLQVYSGAAGVGTSGTLLSTLTGDLTNLVVTSSCADECLTFVSNTGPVGSCMDELETALAICAVDVPAPTKFTALDDLCVNAGVQMGLSGGSPSGGVYSGSGVTDDGNGMTYTFDPAAAGVGTHTLSYMVNGQTAMDDVVVFSAPTATFTALSDVCENTGVQSGLMGGSPAGGVYAGPGVTDDGNGMTYSFDPASAGLGMHTITYTYTNANGCSDTASDVVIVNQLPTVAFIALADLCVDAGVQAGLGGGTPTGGTYTGTGVTDDGNGMTYSFDPAAAGGGSHGISYSFTDGNFCTNIASDVVVVFDLPTASFSAPDDICINAGIQMGLGGGTPTGGVYSGTGVSDDGNGMTYSFDPMTAGLGSTPITYSYTDPVTGCSDTAMDDVVVFDQPTVNMAIDEMYCENDGVQTGLGGGTPTGGIYSGTGVSDDGNGMTFSFDPSVGPATYQVSYTYTTPDGCTNSATSMVGILVKSAPVVTFTAPDDVCEDVGVQMGLGGGTPTGGVYSGPGVTDDGNGMTYSFDPAAAGVGVYSINYSYTDPVTGCTDNSKDDIEVFANPAASINALAGNPFDEACANQAATFSASPAPAGIPNVKSYAWTFSGSPTSAPNAGTATASDGTPQDIDATWPNMTGADVVQTVDLMVMYTNGCVATAPQHSITIKPEPAISCPAEFNVMTSNNGTGDCTADATWTHPTEENGACAPTSLTLSIDGGVAMTVTEGASITETLDLGTHMIDYVISDGNANMSTCSFKITVEDDEKPMPVCTDVTVDFNGEDEIATVIDDLYDALSSTDNCGTVNLVSPLDDQIVTCDQLGTVIPVTILVNDGNGNEETCTANITVDGLPCGWMNTFGLGNCNDPAGNEADYDVPTETFFLDSDGCASDFPYVADDLSFIKYELCGDGHIKAYVSDLQGDGFAGIVARNGLNAGDKKVAISTNTVNRILKEIRVIDNYPAWPQEVLSYDKFWLKIERKGDTFKAFASADDITYTPYIFQTVDMEDCIQVGLFVFSKIDGETVSAEFTNVEVVESNGSNLAEVDAPTIEQSQVIQPDIEVGLYPNPTKDEVNLDLSQVIGQAATVRMYNLNGQLITERQLDSVENAIETFNVASFPKGTYWVNIQLATQNRTFRLIVQ